MKKKIIPVILIILIILLLRAAGGCVQDGTVSTDSTVQPVEEQSESADLQNIPPYSGKPYIVLNENRPGFTKEDLTTESYEKYGPLDSLGRCTTAEANIGQDCMPVKKRGSIGQIKPSGWKTVRYDFVDGQYLYNRCHLIGYQLTAENANERNLITGTRAMNVDGMLPFEDMVADYIKETGNHVLYRVTPVYKGSNPVVGGVEMEAMSVEDEGEGISFHIYAYNNQPGVTIDYTTGESRLKDENRENREKREQRENGKARLYIVNTNTGKFHERDCTGVSQMEDANRKTFRGNRQKLINQGYEPCGSCRP